MYKLVQKVYPYGTYTTVYSSISLLPLGYKKEGLISQTAAGNSLPLFVVAFYTSRNESNDLFTHFTHTATVCMYCQPQSTTTCAQRVNADILGLEYPVTESLGGSGSKARMGEPVTLYSVRATEIRTWNNFTATSYTIILLYVQHNSETKQANTYLGQHGHHCGVL